MDSSNPIDARPSQGRRPARHRIACALAVVLAGALYGNALHNPFIYDDHRLIVENPALADPGHLPAILWRDVTRPAVTLSYAIDRAVWGPGPFGFHLTSVGLHMLNVALLAVLAWRAGDDVRRWSTAPVSYLIPGGASLLFAVHPMMTEAVGYISGRSELLCGTFFLLAMLSARQWLLTDGGTWLAATALCFGAALASKETAVLLPGVIIAYDRCIVRGTPQQLTRRMWRGHLPLLALAATLVVARLLIFVTVEHPGSVTPQWSFLVVELDVVRRYLVLMLAPVSQAIFHEVPPIGWTDPRVVGDLVGLVLIAWLAWWKRHVAPLVIVGLLWFVLVLLPSSALVVLDRGEPMAEHRVYLASAGLALAAGALAAHAWASASRRLPLRVALAAGAAVFLVSLAGRTFLRNELWHDPALVWAEAARFAPDHWLPARLLGEELHRTGRHGEAVAAFRHAAEARGDDPNPYGKLGVCLLEVGDLPGAEAAFQRARSLDSQFADAWAGLAAIALARGDIDSARRGFVEAMRRDPPNIAARQGLAMVEVAAGKPDQAERWCEEIRRLAPGTPGIDECLGQNRAASGAPR